MCKCNNKLHLNDNREAQNWISDGGVFQIETVTVCVGGGGGGEIVGICVNTGSLKLKWVRVPQVYRYVTPCQRCIGKHKVFIEYLVQEIEL